MVLPLRDNNPTRRVPIVTLLLVAVNIAIFAFWQPHDARHELTFNIEHAAIPCEVKTGHPITYIEYNASTCGVSAALATNGQGAPRAGYPEKNVYLAILVSMFLHSSWVHVLGNMLFLWIFGNNVEDRFGRIVFVVFYLVVGALAFGAHFAFNQQSTVPVLGASGAIAGVMGAYLMLWPRARVLTLLFFVVIPLPAAVVLALWFGMQFLTDTSSQVAWIAHVGGFIGGTLLALALARLIKSPSPPTTEPPDTWLLHP
jgi:membrane associated rhomboid family serine protease